MRFGSAGVAGGGGGRTAVGVDIPGSHDPFGNPSGTASVSDGGGGVAGGIVGGASTGTVFSAGAAACVSGLGGGPGGGGGAGGVTANARIDCGVGNAPVAINGI